MYTVYIEDKVIFFKPNLILKIKLFSDKMFSTTIGLCFNTKGVETIVIEPQDALHPKV